MSLYIRLKNNQPFEHPITEQNLLQALPNIDLNNLPTYIARFVSTPKPSASIYQIIDESYNIENNIVTQTWAVRDMTAEEKLAKQQAVKLTASNRDDPSLVFDPATCQFVPPLPYPNDGKTYEWSSASNAWVEIIPD